MIYCVLKGPGGNKSLMRATSSVRVRTRLPDGARQLGPRWRGGSVLGGTWASGFSSGLKWGGNSLGWDGCDPLWFPLPVGSRVMAPESGFQLSHHQRVSWGEGKERNGGFCVSGKYLTTPTTFVLQDMTYLCISASDSSSQNL